MSKPTIHFAFTVPRGASLARRAFDKLLNTLHSTPLHRLGIDELIPWQHPLRSIHAISYHLLHAFKQRGYPVRFYTVYEHSVCHLKPQDIFIGMPLPANGFGERWLGSDDRASVTSRTIRKYPRNKNFLIMPYAHDEMYVGWARDIVAQNAAQGGGTILIGGGKWSKNWDCSPYRDIPFPGLLHVRMGIDHNEHPRVKLHFNPKGKRRYLYMGHTEWYKNPKELERLAHALPQFEWLHVGGGRLKGWKKIAEFISLTPSAMEALAKQADFFVSVSTADPGATTILEQMCFGLVVACTPETGYELSSLIPLSTTDTEANIKTLLDLQTVEEAELLIRASQNRTIAIDQHSWKQFCDSVLEFMRL